MLQLVIPGSKTIELDFSDTLTLENIKRVLFEKFNIVDFSSLNFLYNEEKLTADKEILDYEDNELVLIVEDDTIKQIFLEGGKLNIVIHINSVIKFEYAEEFYKPLTLKIIRDFLSTKYELDESEVKELKCIIHGTIFTDETIYKNYNDRKLIVFTTDSSIKDKIKKKEGVETSIFTVSDANTLSGEESEDDSVDGDESDLPEYKDVELETDTDIDEVLSLFKNEDFKKLLQIYNKSPELLEMLYLFTNSGDIVVESTEIDETAFDYIKEVDFIFNKFDEQDIPINLDRIKYLLLKHKGNVNLVIRNYIQLESFE
jgi:hypothetical protein